jgi:hypothetical protein
MGCDGTAWSKDVTSIGGETMRIPRPEQPLGGVHGIRRIRARVSQVQVVQSGGAARRYFRLTEGEYQARQVQLQSTGLDSMPIRTQWIAQPRADASARTLRRCGGGDAIWSAHFSYTHRQKLPPLDATPNPLTATTGTGRASSQHYYPPSVTSLRIMLDQGA